MSRTLYALLFIATIGLSEKNAIAKYGKSKIKIYQSRFIPLYYALHDSNKTSVYMKLITIGVEEKIIGCHMIGLHTDEILQGFVDNFTYFILSYR